MVLEVNYAFYGDFHDSAPLIIIHWFLKDKKHRRYAGSKAAQILMKLIKKHEILLKTFENHEKSDKKSKKRF